MAAALQSLLFNSMLYAIAHELLLKKKPEKANV